CFRKSLRQLVRANEVTDPERRRGNSMTGLTRASRFCSRSMLMLICWWGGTAPATEQSAMFVPPPRTIADIAAILDQQKPDAERVARARAAAEAQPPQDQDARALVGFYFRRGNARSEIGRIAEAIDDLNKGIA